MGLTDSDSCGVLKRALTILELLVIFVLNISSFFLNVTIPEVRKV